MNCNINMVQMEVFMFIYNFKLKSKRIAMISDEKLNHRDEYEYNTGILDSPKRYSKPTSILLGFNPCSLRQSYPQKKYLES